jgi:hypothetical protein
VQRQRDELPRRHQRQCHRYAAGAGLVAFDQHHLQVTTREFLDLARLRDLADLPQLEEMDVEQVRRELLEFG